MRGRGHGDLLCPYSSVYCDHVLVMESLLMRGILKEQLLHKILPSFWTCFDSSKSPHDNLPVVLMAVSNLLKSINHITISNTELMDSISGEPGSHDDWCVTTCIKLTVPKFVYPVMEGLVMQSLTAYLEDNTDQYWKQFITFVNNLKCLNLVECFLSHSVAVTIETKVRNYVTSQCAGTNDQPMLHVVTCKLNEILKDWLTCIYGAVGDDWSYRILYYIYNYYGRLRINELFDIIVDYPDSQPALLDLKECLNHVNLRQELMESLTLVYKRRLLHHGANTAVIITQYISSIRSLRLLDQSGVILERVCDPVRSYLRTRDDTVTCIMASLIDDTSNDLSEELAKGDNVLLDLSDDSNNTRQDFETWTPDPIDADPNKSSKSRQTSDVISLLVHIYGSQELFVTEYRTLLADRLLTSLDYDTTKELRNLELLKLRFGESNLHYCEIMVKDMTDSRRINSLISSKLNDENNDIKVDVFILSHIFWPPFRQESIKLPQCVQKRLDVLNTCYQEIKGMRKLEWCTTLGQVELELELNGQCFNYTVTPPRACIIYMFQLKSTWSVSELCNELDTVPSVVRRHVMYWITQGLLYEDSTDHYCIVNSHKERDQGGVIDDDDNISSIQDQKENDLQVIWSYVTAMLTNLGPMTIDKIHSMLKMFMLQGTADVTINGLKSLLDKKVKSQELLYSSTGTYTLNNSN